jgi:dihydroorotase-like cyclic amidohydrolase
VVTINEGQAAELTIFNRTGTTTLTTQNNKSKSSNSAFMDMVLNGAVVATIHDNQLSQ